MSEASAEFCCLPRLSAFVQEPAGWLRSGRVSFASFSFARAKKMKVLAGTPAGVEPLGMADDLIVYRILVMMNTDCVQEDIQYGSDNNDSSDQRRVK